MTNEKPIMTVKIDGKFYTGEYIQMDKFDYWLCSCGSFHKGFPYNCPQKKTVNKKDIEKAMEEIMSRAGDDKPVVTGVMALLYCKLGIKVRGEKK